MKIGLASFEFINGDILFNLSKIEKAMKIAQGKADLLCFGETFLQGFDCLNWKYEHDSQIAITVDSPLMRKLCRLTVEYSVDLLLGYLEKCGDKIYSSCALIENGNITHNYRRISRGWKEYDITDEHYTEGNSVTEFLYKGQRFMLALCGDLWEYPEKFKTDGILIWPVYVAFTLEEWKTYEAEYAEQALLAAELTFMVNSISKEPTAHGGAFVFKSGKTAYKLPFGIEDILIVEI